MSNHYDGATGAPENKSLNRPAIGEVSAAFSEFMESFEEFKSANDRRLAELESRSGSDALSEEKVRRINDALDTQKRALEELTLARARPALAGQEERGGPQSPFAREHKAGFEGYMRAGADYGLRALEAKALSVGSNPDGGYLVPEETETAIDGLLRKASPIRALATVRKISGNSYKKPFATSGTATGWVAETGARAQTDTPTLAELDFPAMELYAMPSATQALLDDAAVDTEAWLAEEVQAAFAEQESTAFVSGDGVNKPKGFLDYTTVANASWSWGNVGYVASGAAGAFAASDPGDTLIDLIYSLRQAYRGNAHWVLNRNVQAEIRKFKDADGNYLWQPGLQAGQPASLLGYPVSESEDMPDIAADSLSIAFADFRHAYLIVDRLGVRVLRDPYTAKPYVLFYTTKRVGGGIQNFEAIKLMKFATS